MKRFYYIYISVFLLFLTCSYDHPIVSNDEDSGSADVSVNLGDIGNLGKIQNITFDTLTLVLFAPGEDSIIAKISLSGNSEKTVKKYFPKLVSFKTWTVSAAAKDKAGKTTHCGALTFEVQPHKTTPVTLALPAMYSMLKAKFFPIRDSVYAVKLWVDGAIAADSSFGRTALRGDTVKVSYDYLTASPTGIQHAIRMDARAIMWGDDTVLYRGDTVVTAVSGVNGGYSIKLKCMIKNPPPGAACMTVRLGAIGSIAIDGELEDKQLNDIQDANAVSKAASDKIHEWLQSGSIEEARDKLVGFLNTQELVKDVSVTDDGSVVSVEYVNGLKAVALFGKPGTISYPYKDSGISISVSRDTIPKDPILGWIGRDTERKYVFTKMSSGTSMKMDSMRDVAVTLDTLTKFGRYGFIHIATHGGAEDKSLEQFFISDDYALSTKDTSWMTDSLHKHEKNWYQNHQIVPELVTGRWAVKSSFISSNYVSFESLPQSLVILSFCKSMGDMSKPYDGMWQAFIAKGAKAVVGWKGVPDTGFAREAVSLMMDRMVDSGKTVSQACHIADSIMKFKYPTKKDSLIVKGDPDMQLTFRLTTSCSPAIGGTITRSTDAGSYKNGDVVTLTANITEGYAFLNWTGDATGTGNSITITMDKDKNVIANFVHKYTVIFDDQGATTPVNPASKAVIAPATIVDALPTQPIKTGYSFGGWYTAVNGGGTEFTEKTIVSANITVHTKWTIKPYSVTYDKNGGKGTIPVDPMKYSSGESATVLGNTGGLTKSGYDFSGWNTSNLGIGTHYNSGSVIAIGSSNAILYAQWEPTPYFIIYHLNEGTNNGSNPSNYSVATPNINLVDATRTSYVFDGWYADAGFSSKVTSIPNGTIGDKEFWAKWVIKDRNENIYTEVTIGTQTWMVQNLKTMQYNDGSAIPYVYSGIGWGKMTTGGCCWYNDDGSTDDTYGKLYNWYAVNTGKLAPAGWHVASDAEWSILGSAGAVISLTGFSPWSAGARYDDGSFSVYPSDIAHYGQWWSTTESDASNAWYRNLNYYTTGFDRASRNKRSGYSVRCVRDY